MGVRPNQLAEWRASLKCVTSPEVAATIAVLVSRPMPGTDSNVVHAGLWRTSAASSRSSAPMRASSRRTSSTSNTIVGRSSSGMPERGSASTRAICSVPRREPSAMAMPNSRQ